MLQITWLPRSSFTSQPPESAPRIVNRRVSPPCSSARAYIEDDLYPFNPRATCKFDVTVGPIVPLSLGFLGEGTKSANLRRPARGGRHRCGTPRLYETRGHVVHLAEPPRARRGPARGPPARPAVASRVWPAQSAPRPLRAPAPAGQTPARPA